MFSIMNSIVNQQDIPQTIWKSRYVPNDALNQHEAPQEEWMSGDIDWAEDADEEREYWMQSDLDML